MPTITVTKKIKGKPDVVFGKLQKYCDKKLVLKEIGGLKPQVDWEEDKQVGTFDEKGVKGTIRVSDKTSKITVTMDLPFYLVPFKGLLAESVQKHLEKFV